MPVAITLEQMAPIDRQAPAVCAEHRAHSLLDGLAVGGREQLLDRHDEWRTGDDARRAVDALRQLRQRAQVILGLGARDPALNALRSRGFTWSPTCCRIR